MGITVSSLMDSPAGRSVAGTSYETTVSMKLSCQGISDITKNLMDMWLTPLVPNILKLGDENINLDAIGDLSRVLAGHKNNGGFIVIIRPGILIKLESFVLSNSPVAGPSYIMGFTIMEDIKIDDIISFTNYTDHTRITEDNVAKDWLKNDVFHVKGRVVNGSPSKLFNFEVESLPLSHSNVLRLV